MSWMGWDSESKPLQITEAEMSKWAMDTERQFSVGWSDHYQFSADAVSNPALKGARLVRQSRDGKTKHSDVARAAGWDDLADALKESGF